MTEEELYFTMALQSVEGIGDIFTKKLILKFGSAKIVFKSSIKELMQLEGLGHARAKAIKSDFDDSDIRKELKFILNHDIHYYSFLDKAYPKKLKQIPDCPALIFTKGDFQLNNKPNIAIVGTRKPSDYGKMMTEQIIEELKPFDPNIISGLAFGIDITAHRHCLAHQLDTVAVLAHGLDRLYPSHHLQTAKDMIKNGGGLLTEFPSGTNPDKQNFPVRNRIVSGICDMVLVIESDVKGGAMITAKLAAGYNREVGAIPGKIKDAKSAGCNYLIKTNIASLIERGQDIAELLGLDKKEKKVAQARLFNSLSEDEQLLVHLLNEKESMHIDDLMLKSKLKNSEIAVILLNLELNGVIRSLSGKRYAVK